MHTKGGGKMKLIFGVLFAALVLTVIKVLELMYVGKLEVQLPMYVFTYVTFMSIVLTLLFMVMR